MFVKWFYSQKVSEQLVFYTLTKEEEKRLVVITDQPFFFWHRHQTITTDNTTHKPCPTILVRVGFGLDCVGYTLSVVLMTMAVFLVVIKRNMTWEEEWSQKKSDVIGGHLYTKKVSKYLLWHTWTFANNAMSDTWSLVDGWIYVVINSTGHRHIRESRNKILTSIVWRWQKS